MAPFETDKGKKKMCDKTFYSQPANGFNLENNLSIRIATLPHGPATGNHCQGSRKVKMSRELHVCDERTSENRLLLFADSPFPISADLPS